VKGGSPSMRGQRYSANMASICSAGRSVPNSMVTPFLIRSCPAIKLTSSLGSKPRKV